MAQEKFQITASLNDCQVQDLLRLYQAEWWSNARHESEVRQMLQRSDLIVALADTTSEKLVGFARVLTDFVYKAVIFDVIVDTAYRSQGLGKMLMDCIVNHPALRSVKNLELYCLPEMAAFYRRWGFTTDLGNLQLMRLARPCTAMSSSLVQLSCPGCGALLPDVDGPTHPYLGASAGCWAVYVEVLAKEYGEYRYPYVHRLTVDTYSVQHPGTPSRRSIQSVAVHLIALHLVLERGFSSERATAGIRRALDHRHLFVWLDPPSPLGNFTILDVRNAADFPQHETAVKRWAEAVWQAWSPRHETVRRWAAL